MKSTEVNYKWPSIETMRNSAVYQLQSMLVSGKKHSWLAGTFFLFANPTNIIFSFDLLMPGYISISSSMINLEIVVAGARSGIPLRDIYFEIADPNIGQKETLQLLRWQVFLSKALHIPLTDPKDMHSQTHMNKILILQKDGSYRVNIHSVCVAIVHATCQCSRSVGRKFIVALALLNTAIPAVISDQPRSRNDVCFFVAILAMNLIYYTVMLNILYAAVQEMNRKSCFSNILESMIRLHDYNLKANVRLKGGGNATDDRMITSEIKTIQELICENTDMIRLSTCGDCKADGSCKTDDDKKVELRASLLSPAARDANRSTSRGNNSIYSDIEATLLENIDGDGDTDPDSDTDDTDIESPPLSQVESSGGSGGSGGGSHLLSYYFPSSTNSFGSESSVEIPGSTMEDFHFPQIELLHYNDNFTTWMQCRKILHNFGYRFSFRLNALLGTCCVINIGLESCCYVIV